MNDRKKLLLLLLAVLTVRLVYLGLFHDRAFSGPSTQFEQAFVAMGLLDGKGVTVFKNPPPVVDPDDPDRLLDPGRYVLTDPARIPYIKEVPGYGFLLAALWKITATKTWLIAQLAPATTNRLAGHSHSNDRFADRKQPRPSPRNALSRIRFGK